MEDRKKIMEKKKSNLAQKKVNIIYACFVKILGCSSYSTLDKDKN